MSHFPPWTVHRSWPLSFSIPVPPAARTGLIPFGVGRVSSGVLSSPERRSGDIQPSGYKTQGFTFYFLRIRSGRDVLGNEIHHGDGGLSYISQ